MVLADLALGTADSVDVLGSGAEQVADHSMRAVVGVGTPRRSDAGGSRRRSIGEVDLVLTKPTGPRDEEFHTAITEELGEWSWTTAPVVEPSRSSTDDGRAAEIHELLDRLGVPSGPPPPGLRHR